jgi:Domain of unknown function (DUF222)/HNH endonuclease
MTATTQTLNHGDVSARSNDELLARLTEVFGAKASAEGEIVVILGELDRRRAFDDEGATSSSSWVAERFGVSGPSARAMSHVGRKAAALPHLVGALCEGEISFDKLRAVADVATSESDADLCEQAQRCSVRQLVDVARSEAARRRGRSGSGSGSGSGTGAGSDHDRRYLRCNDALRTMSLQLAPESYAEAKACLVAQAKAIHSEGETRWDQRLCDGFLALIRSATAGSTSRSTTASPHVVVLHVPLDALVDEDAEGTELVAELEHGGLVDAQTIQRLACDATVAVAVDDDVGRTMYEGRSRRFPSDAQRREVVRRDRRCRFPGCHASTFTNVHHIVPWQAGGTTDLENLVLVCEFHHHRVHRKGWSMTGNANVELRIVGPSGRVMTSRPDPRWTMVTRPRGRSD